MSGATLSRGDKEGDFSVIQDFVPALHTRRVMEIWLEASREAHGFIPMAYWEATAPLVEKEILPRAQTTVFLWEGEPEVVGFLSLIDGDHIGALFVDPAYQGRGIGGALMARCKEGKERLTLAVYRENCRAVEFYRRQGFELLDERVDEGTGQPELLMVWRK